jgi:hypothetical protein
MSLGDRAPPHFHAGHSGHVASIAISIGFVLRSSLPPRVLGLVAEWSALHRAELLENWELAISRRTPRRIEPLE